MELNFDYGTCVTNSEQIAWRLDDVLPMTTRFDRQRRFLPESLAPTTALRFLTDDARLALNQIAGKAYMNLFGFVEVYIEAMALEHAQSVLFGDRAQMRALVRFADEEVKHQQLFARFCTMFDEQFGAKCLVLDRAIEVANTILETNPLCVLLTTLHIEQMTQQHYVEAVRDDANLDPTCASILHKHWLEESQHARIDLLLLRDTYAKCSEDTRRAAFDQYLMVLDAFDLLLRRQAELDVESLVLVTGCTPSADERNAITQSQHAAYRSTFLVCGMTNRVVVDVANALWPDRGEQLARRADAWVRP